MKNFTIKNAARFSEMRGKKNRYHLTVQGGDDMEVSDGFHTVEELYDHRVELFIALCRMKHAYYRQVVEISDAQDPDIWRSKLHEDGKGYDGWFILGINKKRGEQITYHLPMKRWKDTDFADTLERAPKFDGHNAPTVLKRLKKL
jgi:hypothetical protein